MLTFTMGRRSLPRDVPRVTAARMARPTPILDPSIRLAPAKLDRIMMSEAAGTRRSSCVRHFSVLIRFVAKVGADYETNAYVDRGIDFQLVLA